MSNIGKDTRLHRLFDVRTKRIVISPLDDALLAGPEGGLRDAHEMVRQIVAGGSDAIMAFPGLFRRCHKEMACISGILNVTASTTRSQHTRKVLISSVEEAVSLGLDGVAVHVNISSAYEPEMLKILGDVSRECERLGMPLMGIMYPRTEGDGADENYNELLRDQPKKYAELVRHAARVGVEAGADLIKTQFTGDAESFSTVVESCVGVPVVTVGGPKIEAAKALSNAYEAIRGGAAGVSFGRNVFNRKDSSKFIRALRQIVHENSTVEEALHFLDISS